MLELLQRIVNWEWRRSGATIREVTIEGSRVWYAEFHPKRADLGLLRRAARRGGQRPEALSKAPTAILLHGLGASSTSFYPIVQQLRRAYRVIVPDLPGCGMSRPPKGREFLPFEELVGVSEKLVAQIAPRGAYLAGNSMGGWIAVKVASRRPDLVKGVALLNPGGPALRAEDWVDFARIIMAEELGTVDEWMQRTFYRPPLLLRLFSRDLRRILRGPSVAKLMQTLRAEDFLSEEEMEKVRCPAVLVWGERDRLIPDGCRSFYLKKLKGVRYEPIPDCGHCPQLECPNRTAEILLELPGATRKGPARAGGGSRPRHGSAAPVASVWSREVAKTAARAHAPLPLPKTGA